MRVKTGTVRHHKHKQVLGKAKGMRMSIRKRFKLAKQAELHAGEYAFAGRKDRKSDFRRLWIQRINAALKELGVGYKTFIYDLKKTGIKLNRKMLADLAVNNPEVFAEVVKKAQAK
ncbi:MAG: 50S ribosomal protein L20 [Patescibacteria group bacterium]|jgi:large subunit ribosomal protein L20